MQGSTFSSNTHTHTHPQKPQIRLQLLPRLLLLRLLLLACDVCLVNSSLRRVGCSHISWFLRIFFAGVGEPSQELAAGFKALGRKCVGVVHVFRGHPQAHHWLCCGFRCSLERMELKMLVKLCACVLFPGAQNHSCSRETIPRTSRN